MSAKTKSRISVTIVPLVNDMLEQVSKRKGVSKSSLVEVALKKFLMDQLEKDAKALAQLDISDLPSEDEWLEIQEPLIDELWEDL